MTWESAAVELIQTAASMGPEMAYGALNGRVVNVAPRASLGRLSFSHSQPDTRPAVHCVVGREQVPSTGIQGSVTVVSLPSTSGASDPAYSAAPLPGAADRYQDRYVVRAAG